MKFTIERRWFSSLPKIEVELDAELEAVPHGVKLGAAVKIAFKSGADLSGADLSDAVLRDAVLRGAVLRGAYLRGADLSDAVLRGAYLSGADLRGADLSGAYLRGADLSGADLRGADLRGADLSGADLSDAVLRGACPVKIENIHQKVYAAASVPGALDMGGWHATDACGTTHCRAGWVIALAGEGGRALEWVMGTPAAAAIIYVASDPDIGKVPDFYCGNEDALDDMKARADAEAARAVQS
jgi:hypothetical protein